MQFQIECFENVDKTGRFFMANDVSDFDNAPLRRVHNFVVEAQDSEAACDEAFAIGNAPWNPTDVNGEAWDHTKVRSMSSGDVVVVHTPDGPVAYGCLFIGWALLPPSMLPAGVVA